MHDDFKDCVIMTIEKSKADLDRIESELAKELNLTGEVRPQLIALDKANKLVETALVADWHCAYASYLQWFHDA